MALYNYQREHNWQKKRQKAFSSSVIRLSYQSNAKIIKNYLTHDNCQFVTRFYIRCYKGESIENTIRTMNNHLRILFNKKARKAGIPLNGTRYITIKASGLIIYNIVTDNLKSAIWLFAQVANLLNRNIEVISWIKEGISFGQAIRLRNHLPPHLFNMALKIFKENDKVHGIEADNTAIYIGFTGKENFDLNPTDAMRWYIGKPRFRAIQKFGNLSKHKRNILTVK